MIVARDNWTDWLDPRCRTARHGRPARGHRVRVSHRRRAATHRAQHRRLHRPRRNRHCRANPLPNPARRSRATVPHQATPPRPWCGTLLRLRSHVPPVTPRPRLGHIPDQVELLPGGQAWPGRPSGVSVSPPAPAPSPGPVPVPTGPVCGSTGWSPLAAFRRRVTRPAAPAAAAMAATVARRHHRARELPPRFGRCIQLGITNHLLLVSRPPDHTLSQSEEKVVDVARAYR
jgi:hypothetical protein